MASYELITSYLSRAGAFHESKVSDLVPELQGRFPIRVELSALGEEEFFILTEPKNSLVKQYQALGTERVDVSFSESGLRTLREESLRGEYEARKYRRKTPTHYS